jgi:hypothetical protein
MIGFPSARYDHKTDQKDRTAPKVMPSLLSMFSLAHQTVRSTTNASLPLNSVQFKENERSQRKLLYHTSQDLQKEKEPESRWFDRGSRLDDRIYTRKICWGSKIEQERRENEGKQQSFCVSQFFLTVSRQTKCNCNESKQGEARDDSRSPWGERGMPSSRIVLRMGPSTMVIILRQ